jgi:hypothetical protein
MTGQIKKAVVGEVDEGCLVTDSLITDVKPVILIQRIGNGDVQIPGKTAFSVRAEAGKPYPVGQDFRIPKLLVKAQTEIRVEIAAVVVIGETVTDAFKRKGGAGNPVRVPADRGAEEAPAFVLGQGVVTEDDVTDGTVGTRNIQADKNGAVIRYNSGHAGFIGYCEAADRFPGSGNAEKRACNRQGQNLL